MSGGPGPAAGQELGGRYRLESLIGRGGMGQVWRAVDQRLRRPVAVKVLPPEIAVAEGGLARFEREAEVTAALQHPNITVVFDIGQEDDGLTYLVMELLEGEDLRTIVDRHPDGLPVDRAVGFALQLADALAAAHSRGIVHRDIKPANLFVLEGDRLKLCDFGIASLADEATRLTREGGSVGTPRYMAPEQFRGEPADFRSDLYAMGGVLHELLTGSAPFSAEGGLPALLYAHLNEPPPPVRTIRPDVPEGLERLVLSLLAKPMDQRPPGAEAVASYLREANFKTAPTSLPPPSPSPFTASPPAPPPPPPPGGLTTHPSSGWFTPPPPNVPSPQGPSKALIAAGGLLGVAVLCSAVALYIAFDRRSPDRETAARPIPSAPAPTRTQPSTPTGHKVVYKVTGRADQARVTYSHPEGGVSSNSVKLPWSEKFEVQRFTFLSVSVTSGLEGGDVGCSIAVDGKVVQERSGSGQFSSASCQYSPALYGEP